MDRYGREIDRRKASNHTREHDCTPPEPRKSSHAVLADAQSPGHSGEDNNIAAQLASAKALKKRRRDATLTAQYRSDLEAGLCARRELADHIHRSIPASLRTSTSILLRFGYAVHCAAARLALAQAHRSIRRLGVKQIEDSAGFVRDHCGWYAAFTAFSRWLYR